MKVFVNYEVLENIFLFLVRLLFLFNESQLLLAKWHAKPFMNIISFNLHNHPAS